MTQPPDPAFFGYGSLVNLATHSYADPLPASLQGWRRVWRATRLRPAAFLSVVPDREARIDGITARVPGADWALLDAREAAYARIDVTATLRASTATAVYQVQDDHILPSGPDHPILLSYLDTVVQGYLQLFGTDGVAQFFSSTDGWGLPIHDDRAAPVYPRAQKLTHKERDLVNGHVADAQRSAR